MSNQTALFVRLDQVLILLKQILAETAVNQLREQLSAGSLELPTRGLDDLTPLLEEINDYKEGLTEALADFRKAMTAFAAQIRQDIDGMASHPNALLVAVFKLLQEQKIINSEEAESIFCLLHLAGQRLKALQEALEAIDKLRTAIDDIRQDAKANLAMTKAERREQLTRDEKEEFLDRLLRLLSQDGLVTAANFDDLLSDTQARIAQEFQIRVRPH